MVTTHHDVVHPVFREHPEVLTPVFRILGVPIPEKALLGVLPAETAEMKMLDRRADCVLCVEPIDGSGGFLLAIAMQEWRDDAKPAKWACYLSHLTAKYECPALLLVVCQDKEVEDWAAGPFRLGPEGWAALSLRPLVLGPGNVPLITDPDRAAQDLLPAVFSVVAHSREEEGAEAGLKALAQALAAVDSESAAFCWEMLEIGLGNFLTGDIRRHLMSPRPYFPGRGTLFEETYLEGKAEGRARGSAQMVLRVLDNRGILMPPATRERIMDCAHMLTLERWMDCALTVSTIDELFGEES
ncbi:hypothetical protein FGW37_11035 [Streptomyces rectiverticillatus]|uniref:hypothetical protein n=1 Tax=Streptomyces rectiverticillatus TaxID=173860 RepID=UPI0015C34263|nr:hypothetical protein [Streptomyces rectiverticillatus]QLE72067.1 hypothetical protein FGW37_11035 [Streptomyces rectiverticillatus]